MENQDRAICKCGRKMTIHKNSPAAKYAKCKYCMGLKHYNGGTPVWKLIGGGDYERQVYHGNLKAIA